jgi:hypothetical protein
MPTPSMTNRQWRACKALAFAGVCFAAVLALCSLPVSRLPSSTFPPATAVPKSLLSDTASMAPPTVAVIGSGLAGLSAAYELSQALAAELPQARVVVFEKNSMLGGNSAKASSGINAVNAAAGDSTQAYAADTTKSGGGHCTEQLVATLAVSASCAAATPEWQCHFPCRRAAVACMRPVLGGSCAGPAHTCHACMHRLCAVLHCC